MKDFEPNDYNSEEERLRQENELKRMKLKMEYGADFPLEFRNEDLPPEIESQFLDNVMEFEKAFHQSDRIPVFEFIGRPEFRKNEEITDDEISAELDRIMQVLNNNQIVLDTLCEVEDRELYRFITEELFYHETDNMKMPGWVTHFTYEEFHPNHEYDLRRSCTEFLESFLNHGNDYFNIHLTKEAEANSWFANFRNAFKSFQINQLEVSHIEFDEVRAVVRFNIRFDAIIEGSNLKETFAGEGEMKFVFQYDYWYINEISLPSTR